MRRVFAACALLIALAPAAAAQQEGPALWVGIHAAPPYVIRTEDGWEGIAIALWQAVAERLELAYEWRETGPEALVDDVAAGRLDLAVGAVAVTPEREARVDFTHDFLEAEHGVAVAERTWSGLRATWHGLTSGEFLVTVGLFLSLAFVVGALAWTAERRRNPRDFEPEPRRGLGSGFWWAVVTMTTVGYGDKTPVTLAGRLLATWWMFVALILTAVFTAQLTANITAYRGDALETVDELRARRVGTVAGSQAAEALREHGARPVGYSGAREGFAALKAGDIDVFVHDAPMLAWEAARADGVALGPLRFAAEEYAIVVPQGSALREPLNRALLEVLASAEWEAVRRRYLGEP